MNHIICWILSVVVFRAESSMALRMSLVHSITYSAYRKVQAIHRPVAAEDIEHELEPGMKPFTSVDDDPDKDKKKKRRGAWRCWWCDYGFGDSHFEYSGQNIRCQRYDECDEAKDERCWRHRSLPQCIQVRNFHAYRHCAYVH